jgi:hypothetical protein
MRAGLTTLIGAHSHYAPSYNCHAPDVLRKTPVESFAQYDTAGRIREKRSRIFFSQLLSSVTLAHTNR